MVVTLGQQYNTGENPTVMLYTYSTYINLHVGSSSVGLATNTELNVRNLQIFL